MFYRALENQPYWLTFVHVRINEESNWSNDRNRCKFEPIEPEIHVVRRLNYINLTNLDIRLYVRGFSVGLKYHNETFWGFVIWKTNERTDGFEFLFDQIEEFIENFLCFCIRYQHEIIICHIENDFECLFELTMILFNHRIKYLMKCVNISIRNLRTKLCKYFNASEQQKTNEMNYMKKTW